jgi:hypothetical protein
MEPFKKYFTEKFQVAANEWDLIEQNITRKTLFKGDYFIEQNKICRNTGFILDGVMRYFSFDEKGNDPTCYFVCENQYVTDPFSFKSQKPSDMNLQAVTDCEIAVIGFEGDKKLQKCLPKWNDIINQVLFDISMNFANQKDLLTMSAPKRYDYFIEKFPAIAQRAPLQYVASYLGIKQPSLSRVRKNTKLKKGMKKD